MRIEKAKNANCPVCTHNKTTYEKTIGADGKTKIDVQKGNGFLFTALLAPVIGEAARVLVAGNILVMSKIMNCVAACDNILYAFCILFYVVCVFLEFTFFSFNSFLFFFFLIIFLLLCFMGIYYSAFICPLRKDKINMQNGWECGLSPSNSFLGKEKWSPFFNGFRAKLVFGDLGEDITCRVYFPSKAWSHKGK